ncbi:30S ribosomal protein S8 [Candidatus Woesearchaeota archaeon]|nr:MAG: 30S ribosomal protein S8 [Candidatus Woesearchaeota archaeon]
MTLNDPLANMFSSVLNCERIGKKECIVKPVSNMIKKVLDVMKEGMYIGDYKEIKNQRGGELHINLLGNINKCGVIKPHYSVKKDGYEKYEKRFLPAKNFGILIVSTTKGMMDHESAKKKSLGGKLIGYCY